MKTCTKCGRTLDESEFAKRAKSADGLQTWCRTCCSEANKKNHDKRRSLDCVETHSGFIKVYSNPELSKFTPRELMAELKARGFRWEYMLEPQKKIMYDKI
jgi:hypothetical protein